MDQSAYPLIFEYNKGDMSQYVKHSTELHNIIKLDEFKAFIQNGVYKETYQKIFDQMVTLLEQQEGNTNYIYFCTSHYPTIGCGVNIIANYYTNDNNGNLVRNYDSNDVITMKIINALKDSGFNDTFNSLQGDTKSRLKQMTQFHKMQIQTQLNEREVTQLNSIKIKEYFLNAINILQKLEPKENEVTGFALTMLFDYQYNSGSCTNSPGPKDSLLRDLRENPKKILDIIYEVFKKEKKRRRHFRCYLIYMNYQIQSKK